MAADFDYLQTRNL